MRPVLANDEQIVQVVHVAAAQRAGRDGRQGRSSRCARARDEQRRDDDRRSDRPAATAFARRITRRSSSRSSRRSRRAAAPGSACRSATRSSRSTAAASKSTAWSGEGSMFRILLPASGRMTELRPAERGRIRILVAEDEENLAQILCAFLRGRGHHVVCVGDGKAALQARARRGVRRRAARHRHAGDGRARDAASICAPNPIRRRSSSSPATARSRRRSPR